jgi:AraC-like DNA-binding protein
MSTTHHCFSPAPFGRLSHPRRESLLWHVHAKPYAAVVLSGAYLEAGDQGRHAVTAGDVLIHSAFEAHLNRFGLHGAEVLSLPLPANASELMRARDLAPLGHHADLDLLVRVAQRDATEAAGLLIESFRASARAQNDWPDLLAATLRVDASLSLDAWARSMQLRPETVSRGFKAAYGVTPAAYRSTARARAAFASIQRNKLSLADIALSTGFADQAHMTRAIVALTGRAPGYWRRAA